MQEIKSWRLTSNICGSATSGIIIIIWNYGNQPSGFWVITLIAERQVNCGKIVIMFSSNMMNLATRWNKVAGTFWELKQVLFEDNRIILNHQQPTGGFKAAMPFPNWMIILIGSDLTPLALLLNASKGLFKKKKNMRYASC